MRDMKSSENQADLAHETISRFMAIWVLRRYAVHKSMDGGGLYFGQLPIMEFVMENPGCTQVEIAQKLGITTASASLSTKRLQNAGFISKQVDKENLRCNRLYITPAGKNAALQSREVFDRVDSKMLSGFSDSELETMIAYFGRIISNFTDGSMERLDKSAVMSINEQMKKIGDAGCPEDTE